jgi:hypothetical protein
MSTTSTKPVIFISYAHADEPERPRDGEVKWLSFVQRFLQPAVKGGIFDLWVDRQMEGSADWDPEIEKKLRACDIFILLVSACSMASDYIIDKEIAIIRERQAKGDDVHFYPLLLTPTPKAGLDRVRDKNLRPRDAKPFSGYSARHRQQHMSDAADEIAAIAEQITKRKQATPTVSALQPVRIDVDIAGLPGKAEAARASMVDAVGKIALRTDHIARPESVVQPSPESIPPAYVHISGLPETAYESLVGRDTELERLDDAWADRNTNILSLVAEGGAGKSALVNEWLKRLQADNYRGAEVVLGWSFYSQGSKERATSAEPFLNWALDKLGIKIDTTSATAKGEAIAEALARRRVLLVLDGVEPLQHGLDRQQGELKDLGLRAVLRRFAAMPPAQAHGLVVLTSRLAVKDIARWKDGAAHVLDVEQLSEEAGAALLRDNGVWGTDAELRTAAREFGGHPLALGLLASFLKETQFGDVRRRDHIREFFADPENPRHDHAKRVMESYEKEWLAGQPVPHAIMHMVGLFERPASGDCLNALRRKPAIPGLTDGIVDLDETEWRRAVARLRDVSLLAPQDTSVPEALDAHPLVREWFGQRLEWTNLEAWRTAHGRLYEHLRDTTKEGKTPTLEDLAPLYQAIPHGCRAGRHEEALENIYRGRICRRLTGDRYEFYASEKLGAHGSDLAALSWFFEKPYKTPVATLEMADRSWVLTIAAFSLRAQGRLDEAKLADHAGLQMDTEARDWRNAAVSASSLSQTELLNGKVAAAVAMAKLSVDHADLSRDELLMIAYRSTYAAALLAAGRRREEADGLFADAERRQQKKQPEYPLLNSEQGHQYCDLLLANGKFAAARERASRTLEWAKPREIRLDIALDKLSLGRAHLGMALDTAPQRPGATARDDACTARVWLGDSVDGLRAAGQLDYLPRGLLARAAFRRSAGDWNGAARDLDEVEEIAEPGPMRLFLCDMAIERARLAFARIAAFAPLNGLVDDSPPQPAPPGAEESAKLAEEARANLAAARELIESCGYHRRDEELAELEAVREGHRRFADLPPRV